MWSVSLNVSKRTPQPLTTSTRPARTFGAACVVLAQVLACGETDENDGETATDSDLVEDVVDNDTETSDPATDPVETDEPATVDTTIDETEVDLPMRDPTPVVPLDDAELLPRLDNALAVADERLRAFAEARSPTAAGFAAYTEFDGAWDQQPADNWCSGFVPGTFWFMHELTGEPYWQEQAHEWTLGVGTVAGGPDNDTGFQINGSSGLGLQFASDRSHDETYEELVLTGAKSLFEQRYNPDVGAFRAWDQRNADPFLITNEIGRQNGTRFEVNIDMMMNMELVLKAANILEERGEEPETVSAYREAVNSHFEVSHRDLVRDGDFANGTYQVSQYADTGDLINVRTHQGAADDTTWSRGHSWAIYGFTMLHRFTGDATALERAEGFASYQLSETVDYPIPFTDYDRTDPEDTRDSSAAAISCSAFLELHEMTGDGDDGVYITEARRILSALTRDWYLNAKPGQESILWSCTERYGPNVELGSPELGCTFGDYYFLECIQRYQDLVE